MLAIAAGAIIAAVASAGGKPHARAGRPPVLTVLHAYVANYGDDTVTTVNLDNGLSGTAITVGKKPDAIAITPDRATAYVANEGDGTITPITLATGQPGTPIKVGKYPEAIVITPDGLTAYVANAGGGTVTPINLATGQLRSTIYVGSGPAAIAITKSTRR